MESGRHGRCRSSKSWRNIARVPYQTWEYVAFIAVTHVHQEHRRALWSKSGVCWTDCGLRDDPGTWHGLAADYPNGVGVCLAIWIGSLLSLLLRGVAVSLCAFRSLVRVS